MLTLEFAGNDVSNVIFPVHLSKEAFQLQELPVIFVVEPGFNRNAVIDLVSKCVRRIVYQDGGSQIPAQDIQIFQEISLDRETRLAEKAMVKVDAI